MTKTILGAAWLLSGSCLLLAGSMQALWAADRKSTTTPTQQRAPSSRTQADPALYSPRLDSVSLRGFGFPDNGFSNSVTYTRNIKVCPQWSGPQPTHLQLSDSPSLSGAQWKPVPADCWATSFVLSPAEGQKTVYVRLRRQESGRTGYSATRSASITYHQPPEITQFQINGGASSTTSAELGLGWTISGTATHYRVNHQTNFNNVPWQAFTAATANGTGYTLPNPSAGMQWAYLQVRRDNSAIVGRADTINYSPPPTPPPPQTCPTGPNGVVCSGNGQCNGGQCQCKADYSGSACATICQRCYGAIGNNCGAADGFNFGFCSGSKCLINAGSWVHDECCVEFRKNGPAPSSQQGSCSPPISGAPPPHVCQIEFNKAALHLNSPGLSWERTVNTGTTHCTTTTMQVNHAEMCNRKGGTLLCADKKYCCSRSASFVNNSPQGDVCRCN